MRDFRSFADFWPFYVGEHRRAGCRRLHYLGTSLAIACIAAAVILRRPALLALAPVCGFGLAWIGHFGIEKNRPAAWTYPVYSVLADFKMLALGLCGLMPAEVARCATGRIAKGQSALPAQG